MEPATSHIETPEKYPWAVGTISTMQHSLAGRLENEIRQSKETIEVPLLLDRLAAEDDDWETEKE